MRVDFSKDCLLDGPGAVRCASEAAGSLRSLQPQMMWHARVVSNVAGVVAYTAILFPYGAFWDKCRSGFEHSEGSWAWVCASRSHARGHRCACEFALASMLSN